LLVDLVQVTTHDGIRLDGAFQEPGPGIVPAFPVDSFCLLHGTGGSFYSSTLLDAFAERLLGLGCAVLRVNTRGHDGMSTAVTPKGGRRQGAAYEVVDDCRHDIAAWVAWLRQRSGARIGLLGHSSGAVKALYALAQEPQIGAACAVALSPPRLSYSWFCSSSEGPAFLEDYAEADRLVSAGKPLTLLDVKLPLPFVITAAGFLEKYGPEERYNYLRFVGGVRCPTLVTLGSVEVANNMAFRGAPQALQELAGRYQHLQVETIDGADHFYSAVKTEVVARVERWLRSALG
jgi:pimeloyl-ACP methyl ester carboxylesterase